MAQVKIKKFRSIEEANIMLNGGIVTGVEIVKGFDDLVGKTITFATPAGSKTFTQPSGSYQGRLTFKDLKTQLEAAVTNLVVVNLDGKLAFKHSAGTAVSLAQASETGRAPLGFPNNEAISGKVFVAPSGTAPRYLDMVPGPGETIYISVEE